MSTAAPLQTQASKSQPLTNSTHAGLLLQRKCACGSPTALLTGECADCKSKKRLQTKLIIGASNDPLEQEADRVADQVLAAPTHPAVSGAVPRIQRFTGHATGENGTAPASVDGVLASPGSPLGPALQQDMEQRFGHDFSRVRVHSAAAAEQSARDVNANAYTVGPNIVFGAGQFAPGAREGRRLIAHELTHVVQQSGADGIRKGQSNEKRGPSPISASIFVPGPRLQNKTMPATHVAISSVPMYSSGLVEPLTRFPFACDFSRLPAHTVTTQALADPAVSLLRQPDAGPAAGGRDAGIGAGAGATAAPTFPTYAQITADGTVSAAMDAAWTATKAATTATSRREQGFWIKHDTSGPTYSCTPAFTGSAVGPGQTGAANPGTKPADSGTVHTVGLFHTHTPMTYRTGGTRNVGPSSADNTFHTTNNVAGVVYDYVESPAGSGSIPAGHPLASPAQLYSSGPNQRT